MKYRLGTVEDAKYIAGRIPRVIEQLEKQGIHQWDEFYPTEEDFRTDAENHQLYVVEQDGKIIATYALNQECDAAYDVCTGWKGEKATACVGHRLIVFAEFQHAGFGEKILSHIEQQALELGYQSIRLDVFSGNPYSQHLYEKHGFQRCGMADWRKGKFYLMEKRLG